MSADKTGTILRPMDEEEEIHALDLLEELEERAASAECPAEALRPAVERICRRYSFLYGQVYRIASENRTELIPTRVWFETDPERPDPFREITRKTPIRLEEGLAGRVPGRGKMLRGEFPAEILTGERAAAARRAGILSGLAVPIDIGGEVELVLELLSDRPLPANENLFHMLEHIGKHVGRILEYERRERSLSEAAWEEQRRLAEEMHDGPAQELTGLALLCRRLLDRAAAKGAAETEALSSLYEGIQKSLNQMRRMIRGIRPVDVRAEGLETAVRELAADIEAKWRIACAVDFDRSIEVIDDDVANHFYNIAREAAVNAAKHAEAERIAVRIRREGDRIVLAVRDDGKGMAAEHRGKGMGLRLMRHRAERIGAALSIGPNEEEGGKGTRVICSWKEEHRIG